MNKKVNKMADIMKDKEILFHCALFVISCIENEEYEVTLKGNKVDVLERVLQLRKQYGVK